MNASVWQSTDLVRKWLGGVRSSIPFQRERLDGMLRLLSANGRPVARFLDLGCGDGLLGATVLSRWPNARGVFLDFSEGMLAAAQENLAGGGHEFMLVDYGDPAWTLQVARNTPFDAIVSGFSIHHQPDGRKRQIYQEIYELLAPGGMFINIEHVASATPWGSARFDEDFVDALFAYHQASGSTKTKQALADEFYNRPDKAANILAPLETQLNWLRGIGFTDVDCYSKHFELCLFGGRKKDGKDTV